MKLRKNLKKIKGDASFRSFYRSKKKKLSTIIVYAKKDKKLNLLIYDAINKILTKNDILAPSLMNEDYYKNFIEIQDFGDQTIFHILKKNNKNKLLIFKKIINLLCKIQLIKDKKIINFKKQNYTIPKYSSKILFKEAELFFKWYVLQQIPQFNQPRFKKEYENIIKM